MLLHKRKALRKAFALAADIPAPPSAEKPTGSALQKHMSYEAFRQLIQTFRPSFCAKVTLKSLFFRKKKKSSIVRLARHNPMFNSSSFRFPARSAPCSFLSIWTASISARQGRRTKRWTAKSDLNYFFPSLAVWQSALTHHYFLLHAPRPIVFVSRNSTSSMRR